MLRLPDSVSLEHKMRQVDEVIEALDLKSCQNTIIGDFMRRGLSGGEKKRCSIASELLSNPAVMMLDEPTSSLDSCTALSLIKLLKQYAIKEQKTIIITIHQPSSQIFYLFDKLLLLSRGEMMYFGSIQQVLPYMHRFNYTMQHISYNPADFLMEISKTCDEKELNKLAQEAREYYFSIYRRSSLENNLSIGSGANANLMTGGKSQNQLQQHQFVSAQDASTKYHLNTSPSNQTNLLYQNLQHHSSTQTTNSDNSSNKHYHHHNNHSNSPPSQHDDINSSIHSSWSKIYIYDDHDDSYSFDDDHYNRSHRGDNKWPSSFLTQLCALTSRNFIDGKARMLSKLNWVQTIGLALVAGAIWFQAKRTEETMSDIKGWMYFSTMYWMMFALFNAITSFPSECQVINKERKYYRKNCSLRNGHWCWFLSLRPSL